MPVLTPEKSNFCQKTQISLLFHRKIAGPLRTLNPKPNSGCVLGHCSCSHCFNCSLTANAKPCAYKYEIVHVFVDLTDTSPFKTNRLYLKSSLAFYQVIIFAIEVLRGVCSSADSHTMPKNAARAHDD